MAPAPGSARLSDVTDLELVLASGSPRRQELLARLDVYPLVEPADIDETPAPGEQADAYVERLAREKAAASARPGRVVLAADTSVVLDGVILGKPTNPADAAAMLRSLANRRHDVMTGVAVAVTQADGTTMVYSAVETAAVEIGELSNERICWYAASGEPDDKAGAYGLQGAAGIFADRVTGSVTNVIGLPLPLVDELFARHGLDLLAFRSAPPLDPVRAIAELALDHITNPPRNDDRVVDWGSPEDLLADLAATIGTGFATEEPAAAAGDLVDAAERVIARSVHTNHPRFVNQNYAGADPLAVVGDWLGAALNTAHTTFEIAPVFMLMERALLDKMARLVGWDPDPERPTGLVCAGGSIAGMHGLQLARAARDPASINRGHDGTPLRLLVSTSAHYSTAKLAAVMGFGRDAVEAIATTPDGAMDMDALDAALGDGPEVLAIVATAGTTVTGAFDPLDEIAARCSEHGIWMHVDGAFGCAALFSERQRWRCRGIDRADSVAWNLHKIGGVTQQCSVLLTKDASRLDPTFASGADYLFQADKLFGEYDTGDQNIHCGRRNDVLKTWLMWKGRGDAGMAHRVDHAVALADHVRARVTERDDLAPIVAGDFVTSTCLWVPPQMRPLNLGSLSAEEHAALHAIAPAAKARMQAEGSALIGYQPVHGINCFRLIFMNPEVSFNDADRMLDLIAEHSEAAWRLAQ